MNFELARAQMLDQQIRAWDVLDDRVLQVLGELPREAFVPEPLRELAFADIEIPLEHGQCMMTPKIEGRLLQALDLAPIDEVLEVGTGSGFLTACLARLGGRVTSIDLFAEFTTKATAVLQRQGIESVSLQTTDAWSLTGHERFDAIAITGSVPYLPEQFIRLLRPLGRLFAIIGRAPAMEAKLITLDDRGNWTEQSLFETVITPLIGVPATEPFVL
jgi:protein-L-isoaspartate(D-aspartate) O-methyltransferase